MQSKHVITFIFFAIPFILGLLTKSMWVIAIGAIANMMLASYWVVSGYKIVQVYPPPSLDNSVKKLQKTDKHCLQE